MTDHLEEVFRKHAGFKICRDFGRVRVMDVVNFRLAVSEILAEERKKMEQEISDLMTELTALYEESTEHLDTIRTAREILKAFLKPAQPTESGGSK